MSQLERGTTLGFLHRRELGSVISEWNPLVDSRIAKSRNFFRKNLLAHFGCVNAIEFSEDGKWLVSGGDDRRVLIWDVHKAVHSVTEPRLMTAEHRSNVFAISLNSNCSKIFSGGNDDQVIVHDARTGSALDYFVHEQPVYGLSTDPQNDNVFASACDDGRILIYDIRENLGTSDPFCLADSAAAFHSVMYNPREPRLIVTANFKKGIGHWDVRMPKRCLMKYGGENSSQCCMNARYNHDGTQILAIRKRLPPVLYSTDSTVPMFQFNNPGYYNSCTMKSCCFAGNNDEFVLSGSDNFDLYLWKIPAGVPSSGSSVRYVRNAHMQLQGHRSIVNQVRYNRAYSLIASSGVEKMIKLWSPFPLPSTSDGKGSYKLQGECDRRIYTHDDYINLIMHSGQFMSLTYDNTRRNTKEDPRMMAFFDALVQRDLKGMSDEDGPDMNVTYTNAQALTSPSISTESETSEEDPESSDGTTPEEPTDEPDQQPEISEESFESDVVELSQTSSDEEPPPPTIELDDIPIIRSNTPSDSESDVGLEVQVLNDSNPIVDSDEDGIVLPSSTSSSSLPSSSQEAGEEVGNEEGNDRTPLRINLITLMIAAKQEKLIRMARAHMVKELDRKAATRRSRRERIESSSSSSSSSSTSNSTSVTSSDSEGDDDDDPDLSSLRSKINPLLWRKQKPSAANGQRDVPKKSARKVLAPKKHKLPNKEGNSASPNDNQRPCTSSSLTRTKTQLSSRARIALASLYGTGTEVRSSSSDSSGSDPPLPKRRKILPRNSVEIKLKRKKRVGKLEPDSDSNSSISSASTSANQGGNEVFTWTPPKNTRRKTSKSPDRKKRSKVEANDGKQGKNKSSTVNKETDIETEENESGSNNEEGANEISGNAERSNSLTEEQGHASSFVSELVNDSKSDAEPETSQSANETSLQRTGIKRRKDRKSREHKSSDSE